MKTTYKTINFTPGSFLHFKVDQEAGAKDVYIFLEMDMGVMEKRPFQTRIAYYCAFIGSGQCQKQFNTSTATIAWPTRAGERRRDQLRAWAEEYLTNPVLPFPISTPEGIKPHISFLVASLPQGALDPKETFQGHIWYAPFAVKPQSLLPDPQEQLYQSPKQDVEQTGWFREGKIIGKKVWMRVPIKFSMYLRGTNTFLDAMEKTERIALEAGKVAYFKDELKHNPKVVYEELLRILQQDYDASFADTYQEGPGTYGIVTITGQIMWEEA